MVGRSADHPLQGCPCLVKAFPNISTSKDSFTHPHPTVILIHPSWPELPPPDTRLPRYHMDPVANSASSTSLSPPASRMALFNFPAKGVTTLFWRSASVGLDVGLTDSAHCSPQSFLELGFTLSRPSHVGEQGVSTSHPRHKHGAVINVKSQLVDHVLGRFQSALGRVFVTPPAHDEGAAFLTLYLGSKRSAPGFHGPHPFLHGFHRPLEGLHLVGNRLEVSF